MRYTFIHEKIARYEGEVAKKVQLSKVEVCQNRVWVDVTLRCY